MKPNDQIIAIAEACGWTEFGRKVKFANTGNSFAQREYWVDGGKEPETGFHKELPDYLNDLNAMHEAEKMLYRGIEHQRYWQAGYGRFKTILGEICDDPFSATAAQRAEAFLKTIGKWEGGAS